MLLTVYHFGEVLQKKTQVEKHLFIEGNNLKIVNSYLEAKTKSDFPLKPCSHHRCCLAQNQFTESQLNCLCYY